MERPRVLFNVDTPDRRIPLAVTTAPTTVDPRVRTQIVVGVLLGLFLAALDQTVVGTALPRIVTDLHGNDIYTWAFTSYLLTATISGPIYGKLSDLYGRRPILLFAVAVFLIGSLLCGLSQEMWQLVAALVPIVVGLTNT